MNLAGGIALLFLAAFMTIGLLAGGGAAQSVGLRLFVAGLTIVLPGAVGISLIRKHLGHTPLLSRGRTDLKRLTQSSEIMKLAERKGGRLTVVEVIAETALPAETVETMLGDFVAQGLAEPEVTDKGLMVYVFHDVQQLRDKDKSRGLLEG